MPRNISRAVLLRGLLTLAAAAGGCQRGSTWNLAPVEGTVSRAGCPLAGIQVIFRADVEAGTQGVRSFGLTDAAGHYELRTDAGGRGAAIGYYRVCLVAPESNARGQLANQLKDEVTKPPTADAVQLPPAYGNFKDTPLHVEVHAGPQVIDLDVK